MNDSKKQNPNRIAAAWEQYRNLVMSQDASDTQLAETRLAFYAGAAACFGIVTSVEPGDDEPTDEELQLVTDLNDELNEHVASVQQGAIAELLRRKRLGDAAKA